MTQSKDMKRLLYHEEFAGYEYICSVKEALVLLPEVYRAKVMIDDREPETLIKIQSFDLKEWFMPIGYNQIYYTSFEQGIGYDDTWWFAGDIGEDALGKEFELIYDGVTWEKEYKSGDSEVIFNIDDLMVCIKTGNSHEGDNNAE